MPRDTDRPDPYISAPLGPPVRQAAPAPAPAPSKQPQPGAMDVSDIGMIMRDCTPKPAKPTKLNEQQRADWLKMREFEASWAEACAAPYGEQASYAELWADPDPTAPRPKIDVDKAMQWVDERLPELHPRRHLDWSVIDPDMIEQAPRRRAAWLPEGE